MRRPASTAGRTGHGWKEVRTEIIWSVVPALLSGMDLACPQPLEWLTQGASGCHPPTERLMNLMSDGFDVV